MSALLISLARRPAGQAAPEPPAPGRLLFADETLAIRGLDGPQPIELNQDGAQVRTRRGRVGAPHEGHGVEVRYDRRRGSGSAVREAGGFSTVCFAEGPGGIVVGTDLDWTRAEAIRVCGNSARRELDRESPRPFSAAGWTPAPRSPSSTRTPS